MLPIIDEEVAARTKAIAERRDWPCRRGCDACCRRLAEPLSVSEPEYARLRAALEAMEEPKRASILARIARLAEERRPFTCPFLDRERGECSVYAARPIACRAFGFYAGRDGGRWCDDVEALVASGGADGVVLGNHDALERELARSLGAARPIGEWFAALKCS